MDRVVVKSKYNKKYHYKFYLFHLFRKSSFIYFVAIAGILSLYLAITNTLSTESTTASKATSWAFVVIIFTTIPFFSIGRIRGIIKRVEKDRKDGYEVLEFTKNKITRVIDYVDGKSIVGWDIFESVYEFEDYYLMYVDSDKGLVVIKSDIIEGDTETFEKLAKKYMKPNKKGKVNFKKMYKEKKND